jgi:tRNA pseudouridine38-40 synthase
MDEAARVLVGTHDFATFRAVGCAAATTIRTIESASVRRDGSLVLFEIVGHGFLRHMVRILAGTLATIGEGRRPPSALADALAARRRDAAAQTAPPHGLTLVSVTYGRGRTSR